MAALSSLSDRQKLQKYAVLNFEIPIDPVPKARPRLGRGGHVFTPKKTKDFEKKVRAVIGNKYTIPPLIGPVSMTLIFRMKQAKTNKKTYPTQRPDLDNLAKAVTDAVNGMRYEDDCQIINLNLSKRWCEDDEVPGISMVVQPLSADF